MRAKVGQTLVSTVDDTTVIVVRAPQDDVVLTCGGAPLVDKAEKPAALTSSDPSQQDGSLLGKRYADEVAGIELLCTKAGKGTLALGGVALPVKDAKALPASD